MTRTIKLPFSDRLSVGIICLILPFIYFLAYGFYGLSDTDQGYIQGLSWRIISGETPYTDFIYVRPPLSLYLHSLGVIFPMPVLLSRLFFYLNCGLIVWLCTRSIQAYFDFQPVGISPMIFAAISFVCTVHNFPPMPWHTTDGLLFAAIGIYLIATGKKTWMTYFGLMAFVLAAFCKQSFYPLILVGPALVFFLKKPKPAIIATISYIISTLLLLVVLNLYAREWWNMFISQTTGVTHFDDLLYTGFIKYGKPLLLLILPVVIVWRLQQDFILPNYWKYLPAAVYWLFFGGLLGLHVYKALTEKVYVPPSFGFSQSMFLLAVGVAIRGTWINTRAYVLLLAMLIVAWCSGLSWGYATPMLFFTPVVFAFLFMLYDELEFRVPRFFYGVVLILLVWVYALLYQYPYRASAREDTIYHAGEVFPKLEGIMVGEDMFRKCKELHQFHSRFGENFTVLPSFPLAHFLTNTRNPIGIDWAHNIELGARYNLSNMIQEVQTSTQFVFIERDKLDQIDDTTKYGSLLSGYVVDNWVQVEKGEYFLVYKHPTHASMNEHKRH